MEKFNFNELRNMWIGALKTLKSMSTQALYFLLEPDDDNKFFESIDSLKGSIKENEFLDFQMLAIEYLLEYKKQNKPKITTEPYKPNTGTWPFTPLDNDQIQKYPKPNTLPKDPFSPFGPVITYSAQPNITYTQDNIASTSIAPGISADFVRYVGKPACRCTDCELFDGHDMCCHHENFGSITQKSLDNCKNNNLFKEKLI
jgi:hypothetical protein